MRPPFWESFLNLKMGDRYTPHLLLQQQRRRLPFWESLSGSAKMGANFESFFSYFKIDVETKTSGPTLKIKPSHSSFQSFRTSRQPNILPQESSLLTKKTDWGGPFQWLQFCDKFQLPFLELLFSRSIFESKTK